MDGAIIVRKEKDFTSFDVVAKMRGICGTRKIGHTGTLDPQAEGVLVLCLGKGTRACELLADHDKEYECEMLLGRTTATEDIWGETLSEHSLTEITENSLDSVIMSFKGEIMQVPPAYSALKVDGRRSYDLARAGMSVEHKARPVTISELEILSVKLPRVKFRVSCSKGTYVRSLCRDIGEKLGCGACMSGLLRTRTGDFRLKDARTLGELQALKDEGRLEEAVIPLEKLFSQFPYLQVKEEADRFLINGNKLIRQNFIETDKELTDDMTYRIYQSSGEFKALYRYILSEDIFKPVKMF